MARKTARKFAPISALILMVAILAPILYIQNAKAANLQQAFVRFDRMAPSTWTSGMVCARTAAIDVTESNVVVTFPTGYSLGVFGTFTVDTNNLPSGATGWLGIGTATNVTSQAVTFPSSNLTANTLYCFNWTNNTTAVQTDSVAGGNKTGTISSGGNTSAYATAVLTGSDRITVNATVPATFTFSLGGNTDTFVSALTTSPVVTNGTTVDISTNASNGWTTWVKSASQGLYSLTTTDTIPTIGSYNGTLEDIGAASEGYVLDVDLITDSGTGTGTVDIDNEYDASDTNHGGHLDDIFQPVATSDGTTGGDQIELIEIAKITAIQAAATDYTDTLTVVAAGNF